MNNNREERRKLKAVEHRNRKMPWTEFKEITDDFKIRLMKSGNMGPFPDKVYDNSKFIVLVYLRHAQFFGKTFHKVMFQSNDGNSKYDWLSIQRIKNEIFGPKATGIQFFPNQDENIDASNRYWLFILAPDRKDNDDND